jgi:hypothetical protein
VEAANRPGGGAVFTVWLPHEPPKDTHEVAFRAG